MRSGPDIAENVRYIQEDKLKSDGVYEARIRKRIGTYLQNRFKTLGAPFSFPEYFFQKNLSLEKEYPAKHNRFQRSLK